MAAYLLCYIFAPHLYSARLPLLLRLDSRSLPLQNVYVPSIGCRLRRVDLISCRQLHRHHQDHQQRHIVSCYVQQSPREFKGLAVHSLLGSKAMLRRRRPTSMLRERGASLTKSIWSARSPLGTRKCFPTARALKVLQELMQCALKISSFKPTAAHVRQIDFALACCSAVPSVTQTTIRKKYKYKRQQHHN